MSEWCHIALGPTLVEKYIPDDTLPTRHPLPSLNPYFINLKVAPPVETLPIGHLVIDEIIDVTLNITVRSGYLRLLRDCENLQRRLEGLQTSEFDTDRFKKARDERLDHLKRLLLNSILIYVKDAFSFTIMTIFGLVDVSCLFTCTT
jgi:hypothetical protein